VLDRYLLAKTGDVLEEVTRHLEQFDSPLAALALRDFGDVLTNWYVRRSRDRFWAGDDTAAFDTLYTVLETLTRAAAPLLPLVTEEIWRGLTGGRSVHLTDWPDASAFPRDPELVSAMDRVREIASAGLALRKAKSLRVRLPLAELTVVSDDTEALQPFADILRDELNVKAVSTKVLGDGALEDYGITRRLTVNARALGPRLGKDVQRVITASKSGDWSIDGDAVTAGGFDLQPGEYELQLDLADPSSAVAFLPGGGFVLLATDVTPELESEGAARDVIRVIQQARKDAGLDVSDRIVLRLSADRATLEDVESFESLIARETLAVRVERERLGDGDAARDAKPVGSNGSVLVSVERA
jgi:isoleucyl-tRNA synthetase